MAGLGLIGTALAGGAVGAGEVGKQAMDWVQKSYLQDQAGEIQKQRDATLNQYAVQMETDVRQPFTAGQNLAQRTSTEAIHRDDRTSREGTAAADRTSRETISREGHKVDRERIAADTSYRKAMVDIHQATENRLGASSKLDDAIKTIAKDNAVRVEALKKEFPTATPERKAAINEEVQLLTGKDNDNFLPVPLKDDMGNITGYQVLDRKRGVWVDAGPPPGSSAKPGAKDRPPISSFGGRGGGGPAPAAPARGIVQQATDPLDVPPVGYDQPPPPDKTRGAIERERVLAAKKKADAEAYNKKYLGNI